MTDVTKVTNMKQGKCLSQHEFGYNKKLGHLQWSSYNFLIKGGFFLWLAQAIIKNNY